MYRCSASSSSFVRNLPGGMNCAGMFSPLARCRIPDSSTSLNTMTGSAATRPVLQPLASAEKLEPLPEPSTPSRNLDSAVTRLTYRLKAPFNKEKPAADWNRHGRFSKLRLDLV